MADKGHFFLHRGYPVPEGLEVWNFTPWTVFDVWFECHQFWVDLIISRAVIPPQSYKNWPKSKFARAAWLGTSKIARALIFCEAVYNCLESSQKKFQINRTIIRAVIPPQSYKKRRKKVRSVWNPFFVTLRRYNGANNGAIDLKIFLGTLQTIVHCLTKN